MPDPGLVTRAQRAATMLERAWERWRSTHGLAAEPLPPVSSYVGYSIEEPWGRPRVVFGVAAEDAERLAAFLQDSLDRGEEAGAGGQRGSGPAGAERSSLLDEVRGRIPVQGWPEFSESREQLNRPGLTDAPQQGNGPAAVGGPADPNGAGQPGAGQPAEGLPAGGAGDGEAADELGYDDDDQVQHAAWLSGIRATRDAGDDDDDEYCDTADDLRATPAGPGRAPAAAPGAADTGVPGWPSSAGLTHAPRPPASRPCDDAPPGNGGPAGRQPGPGPRQERPGRPPSGDQGEAEPGAPDRPTGKAADRSTGEAADGPQDGPTTAVVDVPPDLASRTGLTDTMAAELAGWAAGELPGQATARLAAWANVGGAVARGRQQAHRAGGSTAAERVR